MKRDNSEHWITWLTERVSRFLTLFSFVPLGIYLIGNFQEFLSENQEYLLHTLEYSCLLGAVTAFYTLLFYLSRIFLHKKFPIAKFLVSLFMVTYDVGIYLAIKLVTAWFH